MSLTSMTSPFNFCIFFLTNTPTHIPHSSSVCVSTGPVTGECTAEEPTEEFGEESGDRDLNIEQHITHTIDPKLVTYICIFYRY